MNKDNNLLAEAYLTEISLPNPDPNVRHTSYDPQEVDKIEQDDATHDHRDAPLLKSTLEGAKRTYYALQSAMNKKDAQMTLRGIREHDIGQMIKWFRLSDDNRYAVAAQLGLDSAYSDEVDVSRAVKEVIDLETIVDNPAHLKILDAELRRS